MKKLILFLSLFVSAAAAGAAPETPAPDKEKDCIAQKDSDPLFSEFSWRTNDNNLAFDACDPNNLPRLVAQSLLFIKALPNTAQIVGTTPFQYFKDRIKTIYFEPKANPDCQVVQSKDKSVSGTLAYVISPSSRTVHICPFFSTLEVPGGASFLIHEARHIDGFDHVKCTHGDMREADQQFSRSTGACDFSFDMQGSYGVQARFHSLLYQLEALPAILRQAQRSEALYYYVNRFNEMPFGLRRGVFLQSPKNKISFYDGVTNESLGQGPGDIFTFRAGVPTFFNTSSGAAVNGYSLERLADTIGEVAADFREKMTPDERAGLLDVFYGKTRADHLCLLFSDHLTCLDDNFQKVTILLHSIRPVQFLSSEKSSLMADSILYIVADDGFLYALPKTDAELFKSQERDFKKNSKPYGLRSLVNWNRGIEWGLSTEGVLMSYSTDKRWTPIKSLKSERFKKMTSPIYWSRAMKDI